MAGFFIKEDFNTFWYISLVYLFTDDLFLHDFLLKFHALTAFFRVRSCPIFVYTMSYIVAHGFV